MHALALKDKEEEHAGLLHTAGEIQVSAFIVTELLFFSSLANKNEVVIFYANRVMLVTQFFPR